MAFGWLKRRLSPSFRWPKSVTILMILSGPLIGISMGFSASKPLYVTDELKFSQNEGMLLYHVPEGLKIVFGLIAAVLADSRFGKYKMSVISVVLMSLLMWPMYLLSSYAHFSTELRRIFYLVGIFLYVVTSFSTVLYVPFISEQFKMPQEEAALQRYYVYDYTFLNLCTILFTFTTIELINQVYCFETKCYMIIIGLSLFLSVVYALVFTIMKPLYKINIPTNNPIKECVRCLCFAIRQRCCKKDKACRHFLDYAKRKYSRKTISDLKRVLRIMTVIGIFCIYSLLYQQMESKWVYQANQLNRGIGSWNIKPEQIEIINPLLVVIFAPVLEHEIFPTAARFNVLTTSLQKLGLSYFLTSSTFFIAGTLQYMIEENLSYFATKPGFGQVRLINCYHQAMFVRLRDKLFTLKPMTMHVTVDVHVKNRTTVTLRSTDATNSSIMWDGELEVVEERSITYVFTNDTLFKVGPELQITQNTTRNPTVIIICSIVCDDIIKLQQGSFVQTVQPPRQNESQIVVLESDDVFSISYKNKTLTTQFSYVNYGAIYAYVIYEREEIMIHRFTYYNPFMIHVFWILPQYFILSISEVIQYVGTSMFIYTQSPPSMRSVVRALFMTARSIAHVSIGLLSLIEISSFIWYIALACLLLAATALHTWYAMSYKYRQTRD